MTAFDARWIGAIGSKGPGAEPRVLLVNQGEGRDTQPIEKVLRVAGTG